MAGMDAEFPVSKPLTATEEEALRRTPRLQLVTYGAGRWIATLDAARAGTSHVATPGFLRTGSTGRTEKCVVCERYLRASKTSPTGWRHSGARA